MGCMHHTSQQTAACITLLSSNGISTTHLMLHVTALPAACHTQIGEAFKYPEHMLPGVSVYGLDGFDTPAATVRQIRAAGGYPICYFSTSYEDCESNTWTVSSACDGQAAAGVIPTPSFSPASINTPVPPHQPTDRAA
jgi:hypothetical protein